MREYLTNLFDISSSTNEKNTVDSIKTGISIKGSNAWVLIFSILLASIGLNVSSTAVVIGAMLISPLMGPILGLGLSIAINDIDTLKRSLINLGTMVVISLLTSFLFFSIPLFQEETPELLARTQPDLRDVLIALAGGLALIISISRKNDMTTTIAGVAIATALMPPLCTAGFGLAIGNFNYFGGAFFLFIINSTFIALATYAILKFLNFHKIEYVHSTRKMNMARVASTVALFVLLGSIYTFYGLIKEKQFVQKVHKFNQIVKQTGYNLIDTNKNYDYDQNIITLTIFGRSVEDKDLSNWKEQLKKMGLSLTELVIQQNEDDALVLKEIGEIKKNYEGQINLLRKKEDLILQLQAQADYMNIPIQQIGDEAKINYSELSSISFARRLTYDMIKVDTISVVLSTWKTSPTSEQQFEKFKVWIKKRMDVPDLEVYKQ